MIWISLVSYVTLKFAVTGCSRGIIVSVSPMIWVPNQLVGAPAGTDVTVDCHTEAHPRAISYWVYDNVMVLPTKKYAINTEENSYR
jgi:neurotrimin